jgi:hypothetical protein
MGTGSMARWRYLLIFFDTSGYHLLPVFANTMERILAPGL